MEFWNRLYTRELLAINQWTRLKKLIIVFFFISLLLFISLIDGLLVRCQRKRISVGMPCGEPVFFVWIKTGTLVPEWIDNLNLSKRKKQSALYQFYAFNMFIGYPCCVEMQFNARFNGFTQFLSFNCNATLGCVPKNIFVLQSNWIAKANLLHRIKCNRESTSLGGEQTNERETYNSSNWKREKEEDWRKSVSSSSPRYFVCNECIIWTLN